MFIPSFDYLLLHFLVYAFLGWIIESAYKTIGQGRGFINSGFLKGPIIPIYGFGALIMIVLGKAARSWLSRIPPDLGLACEILAFTAICTAFEYCIGLLYEKVFGIKLWDYSKKPFNLKGRICLKNSLLWALLVAAFLLFIEPAVDGFVERRLSSPPFRYLAYAAAVLALADAAASTLELKSTADFINRLRERFSLLDPSSIRELFSKMSNRYLRQFPHLRAIASEGLHRILAEDFVERASESVVAKALRVLRDPPMEEAAMDPSYLDAVRDILADERVKGMASIPHHDASVLRHSLTVSEVSFVIAERYGLDSRSTARGALLHDFFLYDWRKTKVKHHATGHAKTALRNARSRFSLNEVEADIILTHMWPLSRRFYRYRESFVVSVVDKLVSAKEMGGTDFPEILRELVAKRLPKR